MELDYSDITRRLGEPLWWDSEGCPRYIRFKPMETTVYGAQVALWLMACQDCGKQFKIARVGTQLGRGITSPSLIHPMHPPGGDPPFHKCRGAGDSMTMETVRRLGYWERGDVFRGWERRRGLCEKLRKHLRIEERAANAGWRAGFEAWKREHKRAWEHYLPEGKR